MPDKATGRRQAARQLTCGQVLQCGGWSYRTAGDGWGYYATRPSRSHVGDQLCHTFAHITELLDDLTEECGGDWSKVTTLEAASNAQ